MLLIILITLGYNYGPNAYNQIIRREFRLTEAEEVLYIADIPATRENWPVQCIEKSSVKPRPI